MSEAPRPLRVMVSAGEISGDMYAAAIVRELRRLRPERAFEFFGLGGDRLREEGMELFEHASRTGVIGFWEVLKRARFFARLLKRMKAALQYAMEMTGKTKFKTALFSFGISKNPAAVVMDEGYIENIPKRFLIPQDPVIDKKAIKEALKAGEDLEGIAHLEQSESLRIR